MIGLANVDTVREKYVKEECSFVKQPDIHTYNSVKKGNITFLEYIINRLF